MRPSTAGTPSAGTSMCRKKRMVRDLELVSLRRAARGAAETQHARGRAFGERGAERLPKERWIVRRIRHPHGRARATRHLLGLEIPGPFPRRAVQPLDSIHVPEAVSDGRRSRRGARCVHLQHPAHERRIARTVAARFARRRHVLPLVRGRKPLALRLAVRGGRIPRDRGHRPLQVNGIAWIEDSPPVGEIRCVRALRVHAAALPLRMRAHEREILSARHRVHVDVERRDVHALATHAAQRQVVARRHVHHRGEQPRKRAEHPEQRSDAHFAGVAPVPDWTPAMIFLFSGPETVRMPSVPLLNARKIAWSTRTKSPGTVAPNSTTAEPPAGMSVVWTLCSALVLPPSPYTFSKTRPITWKLEVRFGPALPTNIRMRSPNFAFSAPSPVTAPTPPLKTT